MVGPSSPLPAPGEPAKLAPFEALWEFLSHSVYEDGTPREVGGLSIFVQDGKVKAAVRDKTAGRVAFVSGPSFVLVLQSVEKGLQAGSLDWRVDKPSAAARKAPRA